MVTPSYTQVRFRVVVFPSQRKRNDGKAITTRTLMTMTTTITTRCTGMCAHEVDQVDKARMEDGWTPIPMRTNLC